MEKILIKDILEIKPQPTVVSLDDLKDSKSNWIEEGYYITDQVDSHLKAIEKKIESKEGCGIFLIGHYGSGKSHFLAYISKILNSGKIGKGEIKTFPISLLNFNSNQRLEIIVEKSLGITDENLDRRVSWENFFKNYSSGVFILLDELSEFLKSKPDERSFNEDIRFLQFIGEWASKNQLWVVAAMQEQIEHTGAIESDLYRKIKDRYPIRMWLNPAHVKNLLSKRILRKKSEFNNVIEEEIRKIKIAFPLLKDDYYKDIVSLYPLHPATIDFLEEVRDYYSQSRGIIEFCLSNLLGNPGRGIEPFCNRNVGSFISPDFIIDYFRDLFEIHPGFISISRKLLPFYEKNFSQLFSKPKEIEIANKLLNLLILSYISPSRKGLSSEEASFYLLNMISTFDPDQNKNLLARIYDIMVEKGNYVKKKDGRYFLDLEDTSRDDLDRVLRKTIIEIKKNDVMVYEILAPLISTFNFTPFEFSPKKWHYREINWKFHSRNFSFFIGGERASENPYKTDNVSIQIGLPWEGKPLTEKVYHVVPEKIEKNAIIYELAALVKITEKPLSKAVIERARERISNLSPFLMKEIKNSYENAVIVFSEKYFEKKLNCQMSGMFSKFVEIIVTLILEKTYPAFERFAPVLGPVPSHFYKEFMDYAKHNDFSIEGMPDDIRQIIEGYLIPMKLMKRFEKSYQSFNNLENHEVISKIIEILHHEPSVKNIYSMLAAPIYGFVPDQTGFLLVFLVIKGQIDLIKSGASFRTSYFDQPVPVSWDKIIPGRGLDVNQITILEKVCNYFNVSIPSQWTALSQITTGNRLKKIARIQKDHLCDFIMQSKKMDEADELEEIVSGAEKLINIWNELDKDSDNKLDSIENFLFSIKNFDHFLSLHENVKNFQSCYEKLSGKRDRLWHLLNHTAVLSCNNEDITKNLEAIKTKPSFSDFNKVKLWLHNAEKIYSKYYEWYREKHDDFWKAASDHPINNYKAPGVAYSKLLDLKEQIKGINDLKTEFMNYRCRKLSSLDYNPICECSFNGDKSPVLNIYKKFEKFSDNIEKELKRFFDNEKIREKIKKWCYDENEVTKGCLSYIQRNAPYPTEIFNLELFDKHLSGSETFKTVNLQSIFEPLLNGIWNKKNLLTEIENKISDLPERVKFDLDRKESLPFSEKLYSWILKASLSNGLSLPEKIFSYEEKKKFSDLIDIDWISSKCLKNFENLGLGDEAENKVLSWIMNNSIQISDKDEISLIIQAAKSVNGIKIKNFPELKKWSSIIYFYHERLKKIALKRWLRFVDDFAKTRINETAPDLFDFLGDYLDHEWIVLDCFGLPLVDYFLQKSSVLFPCLKVHEINYAQISSTTTTSSFWDEVVSHKWKKSFYKLDVFDKLLHEKTDFEEIVNVGFAEFEVACKNLNKKLDPMKPILIYSDHGFRLNSSGKKFIHGGNSTLERTVPLIQLKVVD